MIKLGTHEKETKRLHLLAQTMAADKGQPGYSLFQYGKSIGLVNQQGVVGYL
jgi:hypothetical protein